jgi:hypothetical protein
MNHSFNTLIAAELSVNAAIILNNIAYWTERKLANNDVQEDGLAYIYNSVKGWQAIFPYLSNSAIKTALNKLIDAGYLIKRNDLNQVAYDRTNHYSMTPKALEIFNLTIGQKSPMEELEIANELVENRQPIPVIEPIDKPFIEQEGKSNFKKPSIDEVAFEMSNKCHEPKIEAERFYDYYESNGWKVGKNSMKSWKAAVRNWLRNAKSYNKPNQQRANYASNEINW